MLCVFGMHTVLPFISCVRPFSLLSCVPVLRAKLNYSHNYPTFHYFNFCGIGIRECERECHEKASLCQARGKNEWVRQIFHHRIFAIPASHSYCCLQPPTPFLFCCLQRWTNMTTMGLHCMLATLCLAAVALSGI